MLTERKIATVFGGSGFLGRHVVQRLAARGYAVRVAVRDTEAAKYLRPMGRIGQVVPLYAPISDEALVARAVAGAEVVINLVGILAERRAGDFLAVHARGAELIARQAAAAGVRYLVHVSALGADAQSPSLYAQSKAKGEAMVRAAFPRATILRPSIVFGAEDTFFNRFAKLATQVPVLPITGGATKFQPVFVGDVAEAVLAAFNPAAQGKTYELGGPEVKSFRELMRDMLALTGLTCPVWDMPAGLATFLALFLERMPGKMLTRDQVALLKHDNVVASGAEGVAALGVAPRPMSLILPGYLARYRAGGKGAEALFLE